MDCCERVPTKRRSDVWRSSEGEQFGHNTKAQALTTSTSVCIDPLLCSHDIFLPRLFLRHVTARIQGDGERRPAISSGSALVIGWDPPRAVASQ